MIEICSDFFCIIDFIIIICTINVGAYLVLHYSDFDRYYLCNMSTTNAPYEIRAYTILCDSLKTLYAIVLTSCICCVNYRWLHYNYTEN